MRDLIAELEQVRRRVSAGAGHVVELSRSYEASVADLWDACTRPERIARWFLPVTGDLRPGGSYQLQGNAGGRIEACEPPRHLSLTWVFGGNASVLAADFAGLDGGRAELRLRHAVPDDDHWASFGPGAVGVGWDLGVLSLASHLEGRDLNPEELETNPEMRAVMTASSEEWGRAYGEAGADDETVARATAATTGFYVPSDNPPGNGASES